MHEHTHDFTGPTPAEARFAEWFRKNYPPDTTILNPDWHAPRVMRAVLSALNAREASIPATTISDEPPVDEEVAGLVERLHGRYRIGPHLPNGDPEFGWRQFQATPINIEAADLLERQQAEIARLTRERDEARETVSCWEETEFGVRPDDDARTAEAATAAIEDMTTTDELREAVAEEIRCYPTHKAGMAAADRIIRMVVDACARPCDDFDAPASDSDFVNGQATAAKQIRARILDLAPKEPAP